MKKFLFLLFLMIFSLGNAQSLVGTWKVTSIGVGPSQGSIEWFSLNEGSGARPCFFDDEYVFNADGSFQNIQGSQTWIEGWQGGSDACGTPVAPHDGSNAATYSSTASTLTLNGVGAHLGLAKVVNGSELTSPSGAPSSITYQMALTATTLTVDISVGSAWWRFVLAKQGAVDPTPSSPTPTAATSSVISVFSDAFSGGTAATVDTFRTVWSAADLTNVVLSGNNTLKYTNLNYVGIETVANQINATGMNLFHIDIYSPNVTTFRVKLVDFGPNASYGGGDDSEHEVILSPSLNTWNSYDILLSSFTGLTSRANIAQIILSCVPAGSGTVYVDNMYFSSESVTVAPVLSNFSIPSKQVGNADFTITPPTSTSPGAFTYTSSNTAVATIVGGNSIHIVGVGTTTITATQAASGNYTSGTISASFVVSPATPQSPLSEAPVPPTRNNWDYVSIYSDAYTSRPGVNFYPNWGQGTLYSEVYLGAELDATIKYSNLDYQGVDFNGGIDVSAMTKLHIDIWTPNVSPIEVFLIAGGENSVTLNPTLSGWNSFDIDLTAYSSQGRTLNNVIQFKFVKPGFIYQGENNSVYFDNIYFWRPATSLPSPTITNFSIPSKVLGDADFTLTPPSSNSNGAFTYSSSNTSVATISGNTVTIVGAGTTIITATQAATSTYGAGSVTANFIVSFPPPSTAAPTPTVPADRVLSLYSDAYSNVAGTDFFPNWGQSTQVSDIQVASNNTKKYAFLNYQGIQLANPIDVSSMTKLHLDVWTPNCTALEVFLINTSPSTVQQSVTLVPSTFGWNSFDIDLSQYSTIALNNVGQLMFVGAPSGTTTLYVDNLYFTKPTPTSVAPTTNATVNLCKGVVATPLSATGFAGNALKWYTVGGTTTAPTYTLIAAGAPTPSTSIVASPSKIYAVSQVLSNGVESPKATITVNVLPLPTEVIGTITSNTPGATAGTYVAATTAIGQYVGTSTTVTYRVPAFVDTTLDYYWSVPTGVNIDGQPSSVRNILKSGADANILTVNFTNVSTTIGSAGSITVQAQNANGCRTAAKALALTKALPTAPTSIKMTNPNSATPTTAITTFAPYMGTNTVLRLTATAATTALSYVWELPTGVTVVSGNPLTDQTIDVNFSGVTNTNTFNYTTTATVPVSTNVLRIGVKSSNNIGNSVTSNATLVNPTTTSTSRLLTLTAVAPAAPASIVLTNPASATPSASITNVSLFAGTQTPLRLTAAASVLASAYEWELPTGVTVVSGNPLTDRIIDVKFDAISTSVTTFYIGVKAKNGVGLSVTNNSTLLPATSSTARLLKLTATVPVAPSSIVLTNPASATPTTAITVISKFVGTSTTLRLTASVSSLATSYEWELPAGVTVVSGNPLTDRIIDVNFSGIGSGVTSYYIGVIAKNGMGSAVVNNATLLPATSSTAKLLKVSTSLPTAVSTVTGTTAVCANTTNSYTMVASALANSYIITAPSGCIVKSDSNLSNSNNILTTSDLTFTVTYPVGFAITSATLTANKTIYITSVNGVGNSTTNKTITLTQGTCSTARETLNNSVALNEVKLYPNPFVSNITLEFNAAERSEFTMTIYNINGMVISTKNIQLEEGDTTINEDLSSLSSGVYFVRLNTLNSNEVITKKIVKQ